MGCPPAVRPDSMSINLIKSAPKDFQLVTVSKVLLPIISLEIFTAYFAPFILPAQFSL